MNFGFEAMRWIVTTAIGIYAWLIGRQSASAREMLELRTRLTTLEAEMRSVPSVDQLHEVAAKLERIEKVIMTLERNGIKNAAGPSTPGGAAAVSFADSGGFFGTRHSQQPHGSAHAYQDKDEPAPGESLEVIPESEVQMQEMARIEFGKRIAAMIGLKALNIKAAYSLPPSQASNNAFCNSYYYSSADNTLLVHTNRLSSSGDFGLIVIHALSHIKVCHHNFILLLHHFLCADLHLSLSFLGQPC